MVDLGAPLLSPVSVCCERRMLLFVSAELQAVELQAHKERLTQVISALQNDSDRDVRHLLSHLPNDTGIVTFCHTWLIIIQVLRPSITPA